MFVKEEDWILRTSSLLLHSTIVKKPLFKSRFNSNLTNLNRVGLLQRRRLSTVSLIRTDSYFYFRLSSREPNPRGQLSWMLLLHGCHVSGGVSYLLNFFCGREIENVKRKSSRYFPKKKNIVLCNTFTNRLVFFVFLALCWYNSFDM